VSAIRMARREHGYQGPNEPGSGLRAPGSRTPPIVGCSQGPEFVPSTCLLGQSANIPMQGDQEGRCRGRLTWCDRSEMMRDLLQRADLRLPAEYVQPADGSWLRHATGALMGRYRSCRMTNQHRARLTPTTPPKRTQSPATSAGATSTPNPNDTSPSTPRSADPITYPTLLDEALAARPIRHCEGGPGVY
jgi:hypothetical protein